MTYKKPTKKMAQKAISEGWTKEDAERGYAIVPNCSTGLLEIERIDAIYETTDIGDEECALHASTSGFCKIIPIEELPTALGEYRYFGYVDTPKNREAIKQFASIKQMQS